MKKVTLLLFYSSAFFIANGVVNEWGQCGGLNYPGDTVCDIGLECIYINDWYYQCKKLPPTPNTVQEWSQCGGENYQGLTNCDLGLTCVYINQWYSQCVRIQKTNQTSTLATTVSLLVPEFGQCDGIGYSGPKSCLDGLLCIYINESYYQCQKIPQTQSSTTINATTVSTILFTESESSGSLVNECNPIFPNGKFRTGISFDQISSVNLSYYDYISIWINTISLEYGTDFNPWYQGKMLEACKLYNKIPLFYAYVIAFEARLKLGLQDCDVDNIYNLCTRGAQFIIDYESLIFERYRHQASLIALNYDKYKPVLFLIEPDFWYLKTFFNILY